MVSCIGFSHFGLYYFYSSSSNQNKTLAESDTNGVEVHLFEVFHATQYTYQGIMKLARQPYQEQQQGEDGKIRKVWMFPLKVIDH